MTKQEELILLDRVKQELINQKYFRAYYFQDIYSIVINADDWHRIFKTEEFNKLNKEK